MITLEKVKIIREAKKDDPNKSKPIRRDSKGRIIDNSARNIRQVKGDPLMGPPEMFDFDDEKGVETKKDKSGNYRSAQRQGPTTKKSLSQAKGDVEFRQTLRKAGGSGDVSDKAGPEIRKRVETIRKTRADKLGTPDPFDADYDKKVIKGKNIDAPTRKDIFKGNVPKGYTAPKGDFGKGLKPGEFKALQMDKRAFIKTRPKDILKKPELSKTYGTQSFQNFSKKLKALRKDVGGQSFQKQQKKKIKTIKDLNKEMGANEILNRINARSINQPSVEKPKDPLKKPLNPTPDYLKKLQAGGSADIELDSNPMGGGAGGSTAGGTGSDESKKNFTDFDKQSKKAKKEQEKADKKLRKQIKSTAKIDQKVKKTLLKRREELRSMPGGELGRKDTKSLRTLNRGIKGIERKEDALKRASKGFGNPNAPVMYDKNYAELQGKRNLENELKGKKDTGKGTGKGKGKGKGKNNTVSGKKFRKFVEKSGRENAELRREIEKLRKGSGTVTGKAATNVQKLGSFFRGVKGLGMKGSRFSKGTFTKNLFKKGVPAAAKGLTKAAINNPLGALVVGGGLAAGGAYLMNRKQQDYFNKNTIPTKKITGADGKPMRFYGNPDKGQSNIRDLPQGFKSGKFKVKDSTGKNINVMKNYQNSEMAKQFRNINKKITQNKKISNKQQKFFNRTKENMKAFGVYKPPTA